MSPSDRQRTTIGRVIPFEQEPGPSGEPSHSVGGAGREARLARGGADEALLAELETVKRSSSEASRRNRWERVGGWLVAPLLLGATAAGVLFVLRGPDHLFGAVFTGVLGLGLAWILISSLFPGRADRRCPRCSKDGLERLDARSTRGVRCRACGMVDAHASSFLLAEADGAALEDIALRDRSRRRL